MSIYHPDIPGIRNARPRVCLPDGKQQNAALLRPLPQKIREGAGRIISRTVAPSAFDPPDGGTANALRSCGERSFGEERRLEAGSYLQKVED